jgi:hypothetical protein
MCYGLDVRGSIPGRSKRFSCTRKLPDWLWDTHNLLSNGRWELFPCGLSVRSVRLATRLHLVSRSRKVELYLDSPTFLHGIVLNCRSQWPRGLRHELSSTEQTLGSWDRIPFEVWISVFFVYSVFVLFRVQVVALRRADPPSKESYRLCKRSRKYKSGQGPTKVCR